MDNKYIGILTSGGDASGMNAAIRAVTRAAIFNGFKVKGIYRGYEGLIAGEVKELTTEDVSSIIQRGGTILKTARSETFTTPEGRKKAYKVIQKENINALIKLVLPLPAVPYSTASPDSLSFKNDRRFLYISLKSLL